MGIFAGDIGEEEETIVFEPLDEPSEIPLPAPVPAAPEHQPVPA
jgi:hypothetical protein